MATRRGHMRRLQVKISVTDYERLKQMAREREVPLAYLIREGVRFVLAFSERVIKLREEICSGE